VQIFRLIFGLLMLLFLGSSLSWSQHDEATQAHGEAAVTQEDAEASEVDHGEAAHGGGIMDIDPGLMIWTVITFVALLVVLRYTAWKPLIAALEARELRIREAVEQAEHARLEGERLLREHQERLEMATDEAHQIIEEGKADALRVQKEITEKAREEAEEFKVRARREVELAADQAKKELWEETARLSTLLAEKILQRNLNAQDQQRLLNEVLDQFGSTLAGGRD
jgi:F-type H+-transporting ATPase subunit b